MDPFTAKIYRYIKAEELLKDGDRVIVGLSGGGDSVCLLTVLHEISPLLRLSLHAVHINHGLRGREADHDEKFSEDLCAGLGIKCSIFREDIGRMAREGHMTEEEAGRRFRYDCFEETARQMDREGEVPVRIAVAHHMDDQSETVLMNIFRGSAFSGLAGMRPRRGRVIRPLLCVRKKEIEDFLARRGISCCTDQTNFQTDHTRNRIRLDVMPYVRSYINAEADRHIAAMAQIVSDLADHIGGEARQAYERMVSREGNLYYINRKSFADLDRAIQRELVRLVIGQAAGRLKDIEMVHIEAVRRLFDGRTGSRTDLPYGLAAVREYESVKIGPLPKKEGQGQSLEISLSREETGRRKMVAFEGKKLTFCLEEADGAAGGNLSHFPQKMYTKWFDYDKIKCTLCLRRRMGGDYMMISGGKKKLLRRILIDDRIPADRRDSLLVLADGQHVMWLFDNGRISEYYKVTEGTRNILKVEVSEMD